MKIELTKEQYKTLLQIVYWGECVSNSYKSELDEDGLRIAEFEQFIFSHAKQFKAEDWIGHDTEQNVYFPTQEMQEETHPRIMEYEEKILAKDKFN